MYTRLHYSRIIGALPLMSIVGGEKISLKTDEMMEILGRQEVITRLIEGVIMCMYMLLQV